MSTPATIRLQQSIDRPPAEVWRALTEPGLLSTWWAPGDVKAAVGHRFELDMGGAFGKQACVVLAVQERKLFSYSFAPGRLDTTITWTLEPEGAGTRLTLEHAGFNLETPMGKAAYGGMGAGWPQILATIGPALAGR